MTKVVIVEEVKFIREGIKIFINRFSGLECQNTFENFDKLKEKFDQIAIDILMVDLENNGISIVEEIQNLKIKAPNLIIIVLVMNEENETIFDALVNGATAYIHKNDPLKKIITILEEAANGMMVVNSLIARQTINYIEKNMLKDKYQESELILLQKIIEGNNLLSIRNSMDMNIEEIKASFKDIYSKLYNYKTKTVKYN